MAADASLDIITVVKNYPANRGHAIVWRCKVEELANDGAVLLAKRKILAEDHLDYFVRIDSHADGLSLGDKVELEGTVHGDLSVEQTPGNRRHYLTVAVARIQVLERTGSPTRLTSRDNVRS